MALTMGGAIIPGMVDIVLSIPIIIPAYLAAKKVMHMLYNDCFVITV